MKNTCYRQGLLFFLLFTTIFVGLQYTILVWEGDAAAEEFPELPELPEEEEFWKSAHELSGKGGERTVIVGDLPVSYDQTLLLKKGRRIPVTLEWSYRLIPYRYQTYARIRDSIRDESGQFELLGKGTSLGCYYKIDVIDKRAIVQVVAAQMDFDSRGAFCVEFSNPPRYRYRGTIIPGGSARQRIRLKLSDKEREEYDKLWWWQRREQFFTSPVMRDEFILEISSKSAIQWPAVDESGNLDIRISRYATELTVEKDILFSDYTDPYWNRPRPWE